MSVYLANEVTYQLVNAIRFVQMSHGIDSRDMIEYIEPFLRLLLTIQYTCNLMRRKSYTFLSGDYWEIETVTLYEGTTAAHMKMVLLWEHL